jgi:hypothetical protein
MILNCNTAKLETSIDFTSLGIHPVFNVGILKKWHPLPIHLVPARITEPACCGIATDGTSIFDQALCGSGAN